jgi:hypothetical protein
MEQHHETAKSAVDALSLVTVIGTLVDVLPAIAAIFSIVWSAIRIYETETVRRWLGKGESNESKEG